MQAGPARKVNIGLFHPSMGDFIITMFKEYLRACAQCPVALPDRDSRGNRVSPWRDRRFSDYEAIVIFPIRASESNLRDGQSDVSYKCCSDNCANRPAERSGLVSKRATLSASGFSI